MEKLKQFTEEQQKAVYAAALDQARAEGALAVLEKAQELIAKQAKALENKEVKKDVPMEAPPVAPAAIAETGAISQLAEMLVAHSLHSGEEQANASLSEMPNLAKENGS